MEAAVAGAGRGKQGRTLGRRTLDWRAAVLADAHTTKSHAEMGPNVSTYSRFAAGSSSHVLQADVLHFQPALSNMSQSQVTSHN